MNDNERSNLARTIRKYREARKMTMKQLSIKSGINLSTIKKYETDNRNPKLEQLEKIAAAHAQAAQGLLAGDAPRAP